MTKEEAMSVLLSAQAILERNAHLVKKGEPRDEVLTAVSMISEVKFYLASLDRS